MRSGEGPSGRPGPPAPWEGEAPDPPLWLPPGFLADADGPAFPAPGPPAPPPIGRAAGSGARCIALGVLGGVVAALLLTAIVLVLLGVAEAVAQAAGLVATVQTGPPLVRGENLPGMY